MDDTIMWFGNFGNSNSSSGQLPTIAGILSSSGQLPPFTDKSVDLEIPMDTLKQTQKCHTSRVIPARHQHQILENIG